MGDHQRIPTVVCISFCFCFHFGRSFDVCVVATTVGMIQQYSIRARLFLAGTSYLHTSIRTYVIINCYTETLPMRGPRSAMVGRFSDSQEVAPSTCIIPLSSLLQVASHCCLLLLRISSIFMMRAHYWYNPAPLHVLIAN